MKKIFFALVVILFGTTSVNSVFSQNYAPLKIEVVSVDATFQLEYTLEDFNHITWYRTVSVSPWYSAEDYFEVLWTSDTIIRDVTVLHRKHSTVDRITIPMKSALGGTLTITSMEINASGEYYLRGQYIDELDGSMFDYDFGNFK